MCNQEEKCKAMQKSVLKVLLKELKTAKEKGDLRRCRIVIGEIKKEISTYNCEVFERLKTRIETYQTTEAFQAQQRTVQLLIAEMEASL